MNKNLIKTIGLLVGSQILCSTVLAQRSIDIETILKSPTDGQEIVRGQEFTISIELKNNGPDDLITGDTIGVLIGQNVVSLTLTGDIAKGKTTLLYETNAKFGLKGDTAITDNFCVEILDINSSGASQGGQPLKVSYDDANPVNNQACNEIVIKPVAGTSSIDQQQLRSEKLNIFPNPADQEVTIQIGDSYTDDILIRVTDLNGRIVWEQVYPAGEVKGSRLSLNTGQLPVGMFIVNVFSGSKTASEKLAVVR